ncbi:nucleoside-diphosphate-sugar epimerase [Marinobacter sp. LV10R520-4]|uniref:NAD-dependent epimerase/dehydratase family protein n=1 Tax=Marinobacter sp. LV10R520-4 TaxID=1761796 RepID=UPI000BF72783|nr:NAD-dependent epimerase/dehydratase family protein [Marinobacter sp. LV10R520-4]PFG51948.1 nucleoside-diphosphate-sugar epimerase [Marinobacter sp. LV10R520-4]
MAIAESLKNQRILLAGCGNLGGAIATRLLQSGAEVFGLRRRTDQLPQGITPVAADLTQPATLKNTLPPRLDQVIYCLTPSDYTEQGYHAAYVTALENLLVELKGQTPSRLFFVSSTGVYGQDDNGWVDERSPTQPSGFSGQQVLLGEQTALASSVAATVVRFSGIYGPSRQGFLQAVINGRLKPPAHSHYSNRIHEQDAARAIVHLSTMAAASETLQSCYLASDCEPARLDQVVQWIRQHTDCVAPADDARDGGRAGSKLCSNRRLLKTGFQFRYPDFRAGYRELTDQRKGA